MFWSFCDTDRSYGLRSRVGHGSTGSSPSGSPCLPVPLPRYGKGAPGQNRIKQNTGFSSRPSTGGRSGAVLAVSWERENSYISGLPASGPLRRLPGRLGAWLGRGGRHSPARGSTRWPRCRFSLGRSSSGGRRRVPTAMGRLRPGPGGSGGWCVTPGQDVLDRLGLLLYRRELLGKALDSVAEQPRLGDGGVEKACLVDVLHLCQVEPEMALLDHHGGHRLPEGPRCDFRRSPSQSPCAAPASTPGRYYPQALLAWICNFS